MMMMMVKMMMIKDELEIQELLPPISLQFISLAKLSRALPHLAALHCKPLHRILVEMGGGLGDDGDDQDDGDDVHVGFDDADGNGDAGDDVDRDYDDDLSVGGCGGEGGIAPRALLLLPLISVRHNKASVIFSFGAKKAIRPLQNLRRHHLYLREGTMLLSCTAATN